MNKLKSLSKLKRLSEQHKKEGETVALITGCFDIIHIGHISLFQFAKKKADIVIVGVDNDETIRISKGEGRPIYKLKQRINVLSELDSVDYIFIIKDINNFDLVDEKGNNFYQRIVKTLKPNYLVTNPKADKFWREKHKRAKSIGAKLLKDNKNRLTSTTYIIHKLESEF